MQQQAHTRPVKYILVTGGVVSSLGKGLAAASIGALLEGHGVGGARVVERVLRRGGSTSPDDRPVARRRRLRAVADADLRERYGARPKWLEVGGLAQAAHEGLVVV